MPIEIIETRRLYRQIADQIAGLIASGEYTPGMRLPPERLLAGQLKVSRPSVREALIALAHAAKAGDADRFKGAPYLAPLRRLDETLAARKPRLTWRPEAAGVSPAPLAAE